MFLDRLAQAAEERCGLQYNQPVLVGVSGGADSLALMYGLKSLGFDILIGHLDHALRPDSRSETAYVEKIAGSYELPFYSQRVDVSTLARSQRLSIEEAARHVRYRFLFHLARAHHCQAVAVGHHADDQVETVLMHLMRGAALPGLTGMPYHRLMPQWDEDIPLVRPLLAIWRDEINTFIEEAGLIPCVDESNLDTRYFRNRIRHALIPELETYNPKVKAVIWRMADVIREDAQFLDSLTEETFFDCLLYESNQRIDLDLPQFLNLPEALKRRVLRFAIAQLRPDLRDIGYDAVNRGVKMAEKNRVGDEIDLIGQLHMLVIRDTLIVKKRHAELTENDQPLLPERGYNEQWTAGQVIELRNGWLIETELVEELTHESAVTVENIGVNEAWLDFDCLEQPLAVRGRKEGERFRPLGLGNHSQKLQDFFVNQKIPAHLRPLWPLVTSGEEIVWVVGLRPSEAAKISDRTHRILKLRLLHRETLIDND